MGKKRDSKPKQLGGSNIPQPPSDNSALNRQVENGDTITIADVRQFIVDGKKKKEDYRNIADSSWNEVEKRNKLGKLYGGGELDRAKRWTKFPLWWSCWKIRQPLTLARLAIPVLKDTQGDDPFGRTACILGERFIKGILKTFEAFPEFSASNDDFLVTNFGWGRWCYRSTETQEEEKIRLQVQEQQPPPPQLGLDGQPDPNAPPLPPPPPIFLTPDGQQVPQEQVQEDDLGPFVSTGQTINIDNEEVYFEAGEYNGLIVDPMAKRWNKVTRIAFEYPYDYREFKLKFGRKALDTLLLANIQDYKSGKKQIIVYEYHDSILKETRWLTEDSSDFFQPVEMDNDSEEKTEGTDNSDIYGLTEYFPCTEPLIINQSTRSFWPTPEFFQVQDIINDISSIVTRMLQLTRAVRIRFFFDSGVTQLKSLIGENWANGEGTGMGIPNLEQTLMNNKGSLANLVAYFPVEELMKGLQNMYIAYEQRIEMFYSITGFSDLIRGKVSTQSSNDTYRGLQLEGKYAMNRMEPYQNKIQEWIKDNYQLAMELGLKMFSEKTIDEYITPQTLDKEDQQRYIPALDLLKDNRRGRFRMDFETDSTISINQEWKKTQAIETANAITKMMESTAKTAKDMPELADAELRVMKHVVGELTDGKLFMDEITDAIEKTIEKASQPKPPEPDAAMERVHLDSAIESEKLKLEQQKVGQQFQLDMRRLEFDEQKAMTDDRLTQLQMQMEGQIENAKLAQKDRMDQLTMQLEEFKVQNTAGISASELNLKAQQIQSDIALAQEELAGKRQEFLLQAQEVASKTEVKQLELILDNRVAEQKQQLANIMAGLEKEKVLLDARERHSMEQEKWVTEARLQQEHQMNVAGSLVELHKTLQEMKQSPTPVVVHLPKRNKKTTGRIVRDAAGDPTHIEIDNEELP